MYPKAPLRVEVGPIRLSVQIELEMGDPRAELDERNHPASPHEAGALQRKPGRFELADGGTLFLDEIGDIAPEAQVKLLRVLQEGEFERIGGTETIRVDVRIIAATNRNLAKAVEASQFRQDLYYRLCIFPIEVPPLRGRVEDIPLLARYFADRCAAKIGKRIISIDQHSLAKLCAYPWPGNIRELESVIEGAVILSSGLELEITDDALRGLVAVAQPAPGAPAGLRTLADAERDHIKAVLEATGDAIEGPRGAAKVLGLRPSTLRSRMQKLGIRR